MALILSSCGLVDGDSCNPIGSDVAAVEMGEIIGVGQSPRDSSYLLVVARTPDGHFQVFRTVAGEALKRRPVSDVQEIAAASGPGYSMLIGEDVDTQLLRLEVDPSGAVTMISIGESVLNLMGRELPAGIAFQPGPRKFMIAGYGFLEDARNTTLIFIRPDIDWSYEEFRVFFGDAAYLVERKPATVSGGLTVSFKADGHDVKAIVPVVMMSAVPSPIPYLSIDGHPQGLSFLLPRTLADGFAHHLCDGHQPG
jgi:hypothetical protein